MKNISSTLIQLFLFWMIISSSRVNALDFKRLNSSSGLSSDIVNHIFQDREGLMWICTEDGLNRYDGYQLKKYKPEYDKYDSFSTSNFKKVCEDKNGNLWIATQNSGVNILNKRTGKVTVLSKSASSKYPLLSNKIKDILCDRKGHIWITSTYGINVFDPGMEKMKSYSPSEDPKKLKSYFISSIHEDHMGRIWIGSWGGGIYRYDPEKDRFIHHPIFKNIKKIKINIGDRIYSIYEDRYHYLWIGTWENGLFQVKINDQGVPSILRHFHHQPGNKNSILGNIIFSINQDKEDNIWIGTPYGLNIIQNANKKDFSIISYKANWDNPQTISTNEVFSIHCDHSGVMWLGTLGGGINLVDPQGHKFEYFPIPKVSTQITSQSVRSFFPYGKDQILIGVKSLGFGVYHLKDQTFVPYYKHPDFSFIPNNINTVQCFKQDKRGNLWIGTRYHGLIRLDLKEKLLEEFSNASNKSISFRQINDILLEENGILWAASGAGLFKMKYNPETKNYKTYLFKHKPQNPFSLSGNNLTSLFQDSNGIIWVGTVNKGLNKMITPSQEDYPPAFKRYQTSRENLSTLSSNEILSIFNDSRDRLWIGTGTGGLHLFDGSNESFKRFGKKEGISGDAVYSILEDVDKTLWLSTNNGLSRMYYQSEDSIKVETYSMNDGLQGNIFNRGASFKSQSGILYFGGHRGFNGFDPRSIQTKSFSPSPVITEIRINHKPYFYDHQEDKTITLTHIDQSFSVEFTTPYYLQAEKNLFAYKLEGFNADWIYTDANHRIANYTNIPPGDYSFWVKSANKSGIWNTTHKKLHIHVKPAPYKTWWAYTIYVMLFLGLTILIYYFMFSNIKMKQTIEIERIGRAKSEKVNQFKLRFFTNISHELLTPLSVLSCTVEDMIEKQESPNSGLFLMERNINRLKNLMQQLLDFRKTETGNWTLRVAEGNIIEFSQNLCKNFQPIARQKKIDFTFSFPENSPIEKTYFDPDILDKSLHNILSNAFKYTPSKGTVDLTFSLTKEGKGIFKVTDSGQGIPKDQLPHIFDRFYRIDKDAHKATGTGIGLSLTKNLINIHKGEIFATSQPGQGSQFTVSISVLEDTYSEEEINKLQSPSFEIKGVQPIDLSAEKETQLLTSGEEKQTLLLVEDNPDFRTIIRDFLQGQFHILEAENGIEGFKKAENQQPDLIISDVAMPEMDGMEMCKKIKSTLAVSHIPIILLTAKVTEDNRIEGYTVGADSYITKPVNLKTLRTRAISLINQRKSLKEKFKGGFDIEPEQVRTTSIDDKFLQNAKDVIMKNIDNPQFTVKQLYTEMGTSNSMLYRKLTSLADMKPNEFIRNIRLKRAAQLLRQPHNTISETAYSVGFNDVSHFGSSFKKQFGLSPSEYKKSFIDKKNNASG